jgi:predicted nucleic acid-binding protein
VIYLDTSALVKLLFEEPESLALAEWLTSRVDVPKVSSDLSTVELLRTCQRIDDGALDDARRLLGGIDLLPLDHVVVEQAATISPRELRSLDAIHLASAISLRAELTNFVAYDSRLISAAAAAGLRVISPT